MRPQKIASTNRGEVPSLREDARWRAPVPAIIKASVPALPVIGAGGKLLGIFGELEFIPRAPSRPSDEARLRGLRATLARRGARKARMLRRRAVDKHMNTDHIDIGEDVTDTHPAERFLHRRVLVIPIAVSGRVSDIVTRADFFQALPQRRLAG